MAYNDPTNPEEFAFITELWAEAADIEAPTLVALFESANAVCVAYAPSLPLGALIPVNYKIAEIFQARHQWSTARAGNRVEIGPDGYEVAGNTWQLVLAARDLLRPKTSPLAGLR